MIHTHYLFPWTVRYSAVNQGYIVYIPQASIVRYNLVVSGLLSALRLKDDADTVAETESLPDWYVVPGGKSIEAVFAVFSKADGAYETTQNAVVVTLMSEASQALETESIQLATTRYDTDNDVAFITPYVSGTLTLSSLFDMSLKQQKVNTFAWMVRRKISDLQNVNAITSDDGIKKDKWEIFSPIWTWGCGNEFFVTGMYEGWNELPDELSSGTLYAVLKLQGTKNADKSVSWVPLELMLKGSLDGLVDREPTVDGSSTTLGVRWLAVRIGRFPTADVSIPPGQDKRSFYQLHIGMIVEQPPSVVSASQAVGIPAFNAVVGLRYDTNTHRLICQTRQWNGKTFGSVEDGPAISLHRSTIETSRLAWTGDSLGQQDKEVALYLFETPTETSSQAETLFVTAPHEANESAPYEGTLENLATTYQVP